jgi:hypothetical protein
MICTIRNCPSATLGTFSRSSDRLTSGEVPSARHCGRCDRPMYLNLTDEKTVAHSRAGHVIVRATLTSYWAMTRKRTVPFHTRVSYDGHV